MTVERLTDAGIVTALKDLLHIISEPNEVESILPITALVSGLLIDINRIANALETLATPVISEAKEVPADSDAWLFNIGLPPAKEFVDIKYNNDTCVYRQLPANYDWENNGEPTDIRHWRPSY